MSQIETTYKSRDTEETLDVLLYRPAGYAIAVLSEKIGLTPNTITLAGAVIGIIAGYLFYYPALPLTLIGIFLLMFSEALDSADGQLARMTNRKSRSGRILDGLATNFIFISIYISLSLRLMNEGASAFIWIFAILSGASHSVQSAMADYYRTGYLHFIITPGKGELDRSGKITKTYQDISWRSPVEKLFFRLYLNYTVEQEALSPKFEKMTAAIEELFGGVLPLSIAAKYKASAKPLIKYYNILTTNTRMIFLFFALLINLPWLYFAFEMIILNCLLIYVMIRQERISADIMNAINNHIED
jgi:phosphatidylglycerophosphate synthase